MEILLDDSLYVYVLRMLLKCLLLSILRLPTLSYAVLFCALLLGFSASPLSPSLRGRILYKLERLTKYHCSYCEVPYTVLCHATAMC